MDAIVECTEYFGGASLGRVKSDKKMVGIQDNDGRRCPRNFEHLNDYELTSSQASLSQVQIVQISRYAKHKLY